MGVYQMNLDLITDSTLHIKLFRNVKNMHELRQKLISQQLQCCMIKPSLILDPFQVVVAANKAVSAEKTTTKSIYTEILFNLSISKNITHSLQKFGINDKETDIIVATILKNGDEGEDIYSCIQGEETGLETLSEINNISGIKKAYHISDRECSKVSLLDSIISRIATKDFVSY